MNVCCMHNYIIILQKYIITHEWKNTKIKTQNLIFLTQHDDDSCTQTNTEAHVSQWSHTIGTSERVRITRTHIIH